MMYKKANRFSHFLAISILCFALVLSPMTAAAPAYAATVDNKVVIENTVNGEDAISLTDERSFIVKLKITDMDKAALEAAIASSKLSWTLSREKGMQDEQMFPYQFLGGALDQWQTIQTTAQAKQPMFTNIENTVLEESDGVYLQLEFDSKSLFGYNGVDGRSRAQVRNTILDYTGEYVLECAIDGAVKGNTTVPVRPYDSFNTQSEIYTKLDELAERANDAGLYAKVEEIGRTAEDRPIKAIFIAANESDLTDYQALTEREETEPAKVKAEIEAGTLSYKVPLMYSNIHADEVVGSDACMDFLETIVSAAEDDGKIPYDTITSLTEAGKTELQKEMAADGKVWSDLIKGKVTGVGYIQGTGNFEPTDKNHSSDASVYMIRDDMEVYYNMVSKDLDVAKILNDEFFIVVPSENADGKTSLTRTNGNYFDLNRDNSFQTQPETQAMTQFIAKWNPISFYEIHGYYSQFQVEPCTPTHEPNAEYDLFIDTALEEGENFGAAAISNNDKLNSFQMPMRDYLTVDGSGNKLWYPFDDMSTSYTPQYSFMHGTNAFTVELAYGSQDAVDAVKYGFIGNANFVSANKKRMFENQLEFFRRGLENI
ncbi:MAG TPA: M14 family metallopeptidase, partial [Anaerovoracaceae bacterium]|nr:M14 family metallopeptidase [Anaerovoracaceae bacterium]